MGLIRVLTDNPHSEFVNMAMAGGYPALVLFAIFVAAFFWLGIRTQSPQIKWVGDCFIGLGLVLAISATFNSSIKDFGEKHVLLACLPVLLARLNLDAVTVKSSNGQRKC